MRRFVSIALALLFLGLGSVQVQAKPTTTLCVKTSGADGCFTTIQAAIDAAGSGDTINVYPGTYSETAAGRTLTSLAGTYQFGLFFPDAKPGLTVQGVDGSGTPITSFGSVLATINTNATNNFGPSGIFVEGDNVTLAGVKVGTNCCGQNKTLEVIGDNFTLKNSEVNDPDGSLYINDFRFDTGTNTPRVKGYLVQGNKFNSAVSIDLSNGVGLGQVVSLRKILNNTFVGNETSRALVSFNGSGTGVPWFVYSVGGAQITGNTFTGNIPQLIRARGTYDNSQFDWASFWSQNTFTRSSVVGTNPPGTLTTYSYPNAYGTFLNVRRVGGVIQGEIGHANSGDKVLAGPGVYLEQLVITQTLTLTGAGAISTTVKAPASLPPSSNPDSVVIKISGAGVNAEVNGLTVAGPGPSACGSIAAGIFVRDGAYANIHDNKIVDIRDSTLGGCQNGIGILVGRTAWSTNGQASLTNNILQTYQKGGIVVDGASSSATITGNTVTGVGPTGLIAQNGIQVSRGAVGTLTGNTVSGHVWTGTYGGSNNPTSDPNADGSAGILPYFSGALTFTTNILNNNQFGVWSVGAQSLNVSGNVITGTLAGGNVYPTGLIIADSDQWAGTQVATGGSLTNNSIASHTYGLIVQDYVAGGSVPNPRVGSDNCSQSNKFKNDTYAVWFAAGNAYTLDARGNNWNDLNTAPAIASLIWDNSDNPSLGTVLYQPFCAVYKYIFPLIFK